MTKPDRSSAKPGPPSGAPRPSPPEGQPFSWKAWVILAVLLAAMAVWQSQSHEQLYPMIDYSEFQRLLEGDKIESVTLEGQAITGQLRRPESRDGVTFEKFQSFGPEPDLQLLDELRRHDVTNVRLKSPEPPLAVQLVGTLLPWVLIVGVWIWMSRRAQQMMVSGGPLAGVLRSKSRRFDKQTSV